MGTGVVHLPRVAALLAEIRFNGPSELQSEYRGIGGAETGADKISINSSALANPDLIRAGAEKFGSQCIVVSIDAKKIGPDKFPASSS